MSTLSQNAHHKNANQGPTCPRETKLDTENASTHNVVYPKQDAVVNRKKQISRPEIVLIDIFWGIESSGNISRPAYENEHS